MCPEGCWKLQAWCVALGVQILPAPVCLTMLRSQRYVDDQAGEATQTLAKEIKVWGVYMC